MGKLNGASDLIGILEECLSIHDIQNHILRIGGINHSCDDLLCNTLFGSLISSAISHIIIAVSSIMKPSTVAPAVISMNSPPQ